MTITGGCRCDAVRYSVALDGLPPAYACHCHQCQTWSGSAFSEQILFPEEKLTVTGPVAVYDRRTEDRVSHQRMCGICHTRIYNTNTRRPGVGVLRAGTLDDSHLIEVVAHIWTKRKQPWLILPDGALTWPENAPPAAMAAALGLA